MFTRIKNIFLGLLLLFSFSSFAMEPENSFKLPEKWTAKFDWWKLPIELKHKIMNLVGLRIATRAIGKKEAGSTFSGTFGGKFIKLCHSPLDSNMIGALNGNGFLWIFNYIHDKGGRRVEVKSINSAPGGYKDISWHPAIKNRLAAIDGNSYIRVWDIDSKETPAWRRQLLPPTSTSTDDCFQIAWHPTQPHTIAYINGDRGARVYNRDAATTHQLNLTDPVRAIAWDESDPEILYSAHGGNKLTTTCIKNTYYVGALKTEEIQNSINVPISRLVPHSSDSSTIAIARGTMLHVLDLADKPVTRFFDMVKPGSPVLFSWNKKRPDTFLYVTDHNELALYDFGINASIQRIPLDSNVTALSWSPTNEKIVVVAYDGGKLEQIKIEADFPAVRPYVKQIKGKKVMVEIPTDPLKSYIITNECDMQQLGEPNLTEEKLLYYRLVKKQIDSENA